MRDGHWMMVEYYDEENVELYDLSADIREARDLAPSQPERASRMRAALAAWRKDVLRRATRPIPISTRRNTAGYTWTLMPAASIPPRRTRPSGRPCGSGARR